MKVSVVTYIIVVLYTLLGQFNAKTSGNVDNSGIEDNFLETWKAPEDLKNNYPYYLSGYDKKGRPVWIFELGKWDFKNIVDEGLLKTLEFDTYFDQVLSRIQKSTRKNDTTKENKKAAGWVLFVAFEKYSIRQLTSVSAVSYVKKLAAKFELGKKRLDYTFLINLNYYAEKLVKLLEPLAGKTLDRAEIYGTNKEKWLPAILKRIPKYSLPEKYGGYANFTPIEM